MYNTSAISPAARAVSWLRRHFTFWAVAMAVALGTMGFGVASEPHAEAAASGQAIANLAYAQLGKTQCKTNSLGGVGFGDSCSHPAAWCADFAKWVWAQNGVKVTGIDGRAVSFYTAASGKLNGSVLHTSATYVPQAGDAIVFNYSGSSATHVALVYKSNANGTIDIINGNGTHYNGLSYRDGIVNLVTGQNGRVGQVSEGMTISAFVTPGGVSAAPCAAVSIVSATPTPTAGTTDTLFTYTVKTNVPASTLNFTFNGFATKFYANSDGTTSLGSTDRVSLSADKLTWTITGDLLSAGSPRTIAVTATSGCGAVSAAKSFSVTVTAPTAISIMSAVPSPASGTTATGFTYTVKTSEAASKLKFTFNGNSTEYFVYNNGTTTLGSTDKVTITDGGKTWTITGDKLKAGKRTVTVTAYTSNAKVLAVKSFPVTVS